MLFQVDGFGLTQEFRLLAFVMLCPMIIGMNITASSLPRRDLIRMVCFDPFIQVP
jgi:hypothetical protein